MANWVSKKLFGTRKTREEELASNLYDALILDEGPSSDVDDHLDANSLEIPLDKLARFSAKRLIMLEAFLFVAINTATMPKDDKVHPLFPAVHPLSLEMGKLLHTKWKERGIKLSGAGAVGERCFAEVEDALDKPFKWGRSWLDEFYADPDRSGEFYIAWTEQCIKEFKAMLLVVEQYA